MFFLFLKAIGVAFAIAAPVGPTAVLCVTRTVKQGLREGLLSGAGAASADAFFGLLSGFGVGFIINVATHHREAIRLAGGAFLIYWGARIIVSKFAESHPLVKGKGFGGSYISTFILTLTNPMTLLAFMAVLAVLGQNGINHDVFSLAQWILGICIGSFIWWFAICIVAHRFREKFQDKGLLLMNRATGVIVIAAGLFSLLNYKK